MRRLRVGDHGSCKCGINMQQNMLNIKYSCVFLLLLVDVYVAARAVAPSRLHFNQAHSFDLINSLAATRQQTHETNSLATTTATKVVNNNSENSHLQSYGSFHFLFIFFYFSSLLLLLLKQFGLRNNLALTYRYFGSVLVFFLAKFLAVIT